MLSFLGLPPVEMVHVAADLGCTHISTGLMQMPAQYNPLGYPDWSLQSDPMLRREMISALHERSVSISLGEGFAMRPDVNMADRAADMDTMAELGARGLGAVSMEPDEPRAMDEFAELAEMAGERGMLATIEFAPIQVVNSLNKAIEFVRHADRANCGLLIDAMHFFRSGGLVKQIAAIDPAMIRYAQLCDAPAGGPGPDYMTEAMFGRRVPGEGEFPLAAFVAALPKDIPLGLEIPMLAKAQAGIGPVDRMRLAVEAIRTMIKGD